MSSATYAVTYTSVYTDSEPGRALWGADDEEISEGEPIYPEYIPLEDEHEFSAEEQPLPPVVSHTVELISPPEGTKPVIPPPSTDITTTGARITVR
ncbi:hypothetical protein Tco_0361647, partial [Tanacetum coccineum]